MIEEENKIIDRVMMIDRWKTSGDIYTQDELNAIGILLDLYYKQQKDIEEKNIAINKMSKDISHQLNEIEEKSTIIMAGAKKVKQLEKEIEDMREELQMYVDIGNNNLHNYISKDKIREKINQLKEVADEDNPDIFTKIDAYEELLEDN